jgi:hypothetical protein
VSDANAVDAATAISNVISTLSSSMNHGAFSYYGERITLALATAYFAYVGITNVLSGRSASETLAEGVMLIITVGMTLWVVTSPELFTAVYNGFEYLAALVLNAVPGVSVSSSENGLQQGLSALVTVSANMFMETDASGALGASNESSGVVVWIFKIVISFLMLLITLFYVAAYTASQVMFVIGAILTPIMVPFYVVPALSFLAESWFKFIVVAGFQKLVGTMILAITLGLATKATEISNSFRADESMLQFGLFAVLAVVTGIMGFLMMSSMPIGSALVAGMGANAKVIPDALSPNRMVGASSKGTVAAARGVGNVASRAGGAIAGGIRGFGRGKP